MAVAFPSAPNVGDRVSDATTGATWEFDGVGWIAAPRAPVGGGGITHGLTWHDAKLNDTTFWLNDTGEAHQITTLNGVVDEAAGATAFIDIVLATSGQPLSVGTVIATFDANGTVGAVQNLSGVGTTVPDGARLGFLTR